MTTTSAPVGSVIQPCPFCGGKNVKPFGPYGWYRQWGISHSCKSFYSGTSEMMQGFRNEAEAIAAWNTRGQIEQSSRVGEGAPVSCPKCSHGRLRPKLRCDECATVFPVNAALANPPLAPVVVREALEAVAADLRLNEQGGFITTDLHETTIAKVRAALQSSPSSHVVAGYALVPVEPTEEMIDAGRKAQDDGSVFYVEDAYKAMISAAPALQAGEGE